MDFAASTPLDPRVARAMRKVEDVYGNPSALHEEGRRSRDLLEGARTRIARSLSVRSEELVFTGSGTESNNLAIRGVTRPDLPAGRQAHIVTTTFEHPSVEEPIAMWEKEGVPVTRVAPNADGIVTVDAIEKALRPDTTLVSIVLVQSEIGTVQPLKEISRMLATKSPKPIFHTDASQAPLWMDASPHALGVDLATYDAHKIMGPKGVGLLWRDYAVPLRAVTFGGSQERKLRPATENVSGAVGMAEAFDLASHKRKERVEKVRGVRDYFVELLKKEIPQVEINGSLKDRVANNVHISIPNVDGDYLTVLMDTHGVAVSPRSACVTSGAPSSAVLAIGKSGSLARGTLRFTLGPDASKRDVHRAVLALKEFLGVIS